MTDLELQQEAVRLLLVRLGNEGREWYRNAKLGDDDPFEDRVSSNYALFEGNEIHEIGPKPTGAFPRRKILLTPSISRDKGAVVGFWLRWDFSKSPIEFRLFLGLWYQAQGQRNFNGYRFDAPETGDDHDYYHCQPCRNFGDKDILSEAALVSERFPTIPLNASNIVELTVCGLMATLGRKRMKSFLQKLISSDGSSNKFLTNAYLRCAKSPSIDLVE